MNRYAIAEIATAKTITSTSVGGFGYGLIWLMIARLAVNLHFISGFVEFGLFLLQKFVQVLNLGDERFEQSLWCPVNAAIFQAVVSEIVQRDHFSSAINL